MCIYIYIYIYIYIHYLNFLLMGKLQNKPAEVADILNYFVDSVENIIKYFTSEYKNTFCQVKQTEPAFNIVSITESDVMRVIRSLRPSRAKDVIGMNTCMLKELSEVLVNSITKLVNLSFAHWMFPNEWKLAAVIPYLKEVIYPPATIDLLAFCPWFPRWPKN